MRILFSSLLALGFLAGLSACDSAQETQTLSSLADETCASFTPGLIQYEILKGNDFVQGFAAVTQDHLCKKRYVKIDDCSTDKEAMQLTGFFQTKPRLIDADSSDYEAFFEQVERNDQSGDFQRLPHISCKAGASFPLEKIEKGTFVVVDSSNLGRSSFVAKTESKGKIIYSFPSICTRIKSFFNLDRLFSNDDVTVLEQLPRLLPDDSEIRFGCGFERPTSAKTDVWHVYRIVNSDSLFYLLRYAASRADEAVELLITSADGESIELDDLDLAADLQKTFKTPIEIPDFSLDFSDGALDRPLLDICLKSCGTRFPAHMVLKGRPEPWWPNGAPDNDSPTKETYRQDLTVQPDGQVMDTIALPSGKRLSFPPCSIGSRFGFLASGKAMTTFAEWNRGIQRSIDDDTIDPLVVPCTIPQGEVCRQSIAANTDLSTAISQQLIANSRKRPECAKSETLRFELQGEAIVSSTAWTVGETTSTNPYRNIQIVGRSPEAAIVQRLKCNITKTCADIETPVLRIVGNAVVSLQGFKIRTESEATLVKTVAIVRDQPIDLFTKLHLRKVEIGNRTNRFHTGIRLVGGLNFFHDISLQAYFTGIKAVSSKLTVTGSRMKGTDQIVPKGEAHITVLDIGPVEAQPYRSEFSYGKADGAAIQATTSEGWVYLTNSRAPRGWALGAKTQINANRVDLANSDNLIRGASRAFAVADAARLDIGILKVQNYGTLVQFTGGNLVGARASFDVFMRDSYTTSAANLIMGDAFGLINFDEATGTEKGLSCSEEPGTDRCML